MRKKEYKIETKIETEIVTKKAYSEKGIQHIEQIEKNIERLKELGFNVCEKDKIIV